MARNPLLRKLEDLARKGVPKAVARARSNFVSMLKTLTGAEEIREKDIFTRAYVDHSPNLRKLSPTFNQHANDRKDRLVTRLGVKHIGSMVMFMYDPKHKETLPYYDRLPLVLPMEFHQKGYMLGLNLHYLPPKLRAMLLDTLVENALKPKLVNENKRVQFSYNIMKQAADSNAYKPCIKKYIITSAHVKSRFLIVPPEEWAETLFLPFERFEKKSSADVFRESVRTIRTR